MLLGANYGDSAVTGGNYRNLNGQPNGLTEYVDNSADSLEMFAVDRWRLAPALDTDLRRAVGECGPGRAHYRRRDRRGAKSRLTTHRSTRASASSIR